MVAFHKILLGQGAIPYDAEHYNYPLSKFLFDELSAGRDPLLDRFVYSGIPFFSNPQSMQYYPPQQILHALLQRVGADLTIYRYEMFALAHLLLLLSGSYLYALRRSTERSVPVALALALSLTFGGALIANLQHVGLIAAICWFPWLLLASDRLRARASFGAWSAVVLLFWLIITSGFLPGVTGLLLVYGLYTISSCADARPFTFGRSTLLSLGPIAAAFGVGLLLAAPTVLPLAASLPASTPVFRQTTLGDLDLLTLFLPQALHSFDLSRYQGHDDATVSYFYFGPIILFGLAALPLNARKNPVQTASILLLLLVEFWPDNALLRLLQALPRVGVLIRPATLLYFTFFLLIANLANVERDRMRTLAFLASGAFVVFSGGAIAFAKAADLSVGGRGLNIFLAINVAFFATIVLWTRTRADAGSIVVAALLVSALGLVAYHTSANQGLWLGGPKNAYGPNWVNVSDFADIELLKSGPVPYRVAANQKRIRGPFDDAWRVWRVESVVGFEPLVDESYLEAMSPIAARVGDRALGPFVADSPLWEKLNVLYYVTGARDLSFEAGALQNWELVKEKPLRIYRNRNFQPRYRVEGDCADSAKIDVLQYDSQGASLHVDAPCQNARLFISENRSPWWQVSVDGSAVATRDAPGFGFTVPIPAGTSRVNLQYACDTVTISRRISLGTLIALIALCGAMAFFQGSRVVRRRTVVETS